MPFQVSPGVNVSEIDLTTIVPAVSTSVAAAAGVFRWGPVGKAVLVSNEDQLAARFGKPTNLNAETWFNAASFLAHSTALQVSRSYDLDNSNTSLRTYSALAISEGGTTPDDADHVAATVLNEDDYDLKTFPSDVHFVARYPGALGNSLKVSVCSGSNAFSTTITLTDFEDNANVTSDGFDLSVGSSSGVVRYLNANSSITDSTDTLASATALSNSLQVGDIIRVGNSTIGYQSLTISALTVAAEQDGSSVDTGPSRLTITFTDTLKLSADIADATTLDRRWEYYAEFARAPGQSNWQDAYGADVNDEMHVVVVDEDGQFTNIPGTVLESYTAVSRATDGKLDTGAANYWRDVINDSSAYVWITDNDPDGMTSAAGADLTAANTSVGASIYTASFQGGQDGGTESTVTLGKVLQAWDVFKEPEDIDVSLLLTGKSLGGVHGEQVGNYLIDNIAEYRKDCVAFISPQYEDVVNNSAGDQDQDCVQFRNALRSTSYAMLDSGYKYMYDKYNDVYRWIPLNGDIAGVCAATDDNRDPWFSPAGITRGRIKNVVKLAWSPNQAQRDVLYVNGINPVVNFKGEGIILYGDKTLLAKPSAFDRINVRRLFIVLEKAIARASRSTLFEFNDEFTRASFVSIVEPYLRDIKGRRGVTDYLVVCDATNNTPSVVDRNEFVGDIYIKPSRAINFIQLNFVAIRSGVEFSEIITNG